MNSQAISILTALTWLWSSQIWLNTKPPLALAMKTLFLHNKWLLDKNYFRISRKVSRRGFPVKMSSNQLGENMCPRLKLRLMMRKELKPRRSYRLNRFSTP
jgi:hypothetical protein